jgi:taurine--2-oxoglutarate transaminase
LIADEVITGLGRTGAWFAVDHEGVVPDMLLLAKGLTAGYVAMGAVVLREAIAQHFETRMLSLGCTYGGQPLACAAGLAALEEYGQPGFMDHVRRMGERLSTQLRNLAERRRCVGDVRGKGLIWCVELLRNRATKEPLLPPNTDSLLPMQIRNRAWDEGLHLLARGSLLMLAPPLVIQPEQIDEGVAKLDRVLGWLEETEHLQ